MGLLSLTSSAASGNRKSGHGNDGTRVLQPPRKQLIVVTLEMLRARLLSFILLGYRMSFEPHPSSL